MSILVFWRAMVLCMLGLLLSACSEDMLATYPTTEENLSAFVGYTEVRISDARETYTHYSEDGTYHSFQKNYDGQVTTVIEGTWRLQSRERPFPDMMFREGTMYYGAGPVIAESTSSRWMFRSDFPQPPRVKGFPQRSEYDAALRKFKSMVQAPVDSHVVSGGAAIALGVVVIPLCIATAMILC